MSFLTLSLFVRFPLSFSARSCSPQATPYLSSVRPRRVSREWSRTGARRVARRTGDAARLVGGHVGPRGRPIGARADVSSLTKDVFINEAWVVYVFGGSVLTEPSLKRFRVTPRRGRGAPISLLAGYHRTLHAFSLSVCHACVGAYCREKEGRNLLVARRARTLACTCASCPRQQGRRRRPCHPPSRRWITSLRLALSRELFDRSNIVTLLLSSRPDVSIRWCFNLTFIYVELYFGIFIAIS